MFADLGIPVLDADVIAREIVEPGQPALDKIKIEFGNGYFLPDGSLDRAKLRDHIFSLPNERLKLESILHPRIQEVMVERLAELTSPYCILVIPLLIEVEQQSLVDRILVVDTPEALCIQRITHRDGMTEAVAKKILATQVDRTTRLAQADDVLVNEGSIAQLRARVDQLHERYLDIAASMKGASK